MRADVGCCWVGILDPKLTYTKNFGMSEKRSERSRKPRYLKTSPRVAGNKNWLRCSSAKVSILKNDVQQNALIAKSAFQHESL